MDNDEYRAEAFRQLMAASDRKIIRILDLLTVIKRQDGAIVSLGASDLTEGQRRAYGAIVGGLIGLGAEGARGAVDAAINGSNAFAEHNFGLNRAEIRRMADDIPPGKTVMLALFEHKWAVRLKQAILNANGVMLADALVDPESLVEFGEAIAVAERDE